MLKYVQSKQSSLFSYYPTKVVVVVRTGIGNGTGTRSSVRTAFRAKSGKNRKNIMTINDLHFLFLLNGLIPEGVVP